jgi:hypothetical protein
LCKLQNSNYYYFDTGSIALYQNGKGWKSAYLEFRIWPTRQLLPVITHSSKKIRVRDRLQPYHYIEISGLFCTSVLFFNHNKHKSTDFSKNEHRKFCLKHVDKSMSFKFYLPYQHMSGLSFQCLEQYFLADPLVMLK